MDYTSVLRLDRGIDRTVEPVPDDTPGILPGTLVVNSAGVVYVECGLRQQIREARAGVKIPANAGRILARFSSRESRPLDPKPLAVYGSFGSPTTSAAYPQVVMRPERDVPSGATRFFPGERGGRVDVGTVVPPPLEALVKEGKSEKNPWPPACSVKSAPGYCCVRDLSDEEARAAAATLGPWPRAGDVLKYSQVEGLSVLAGVRVVQVAPGLYHALARQEISLSEGKGAPITIADLKPDDRVGGFPLRVGSLGIFSASVAPVGKGGRPQSGAVSPEALFDGIGIDAIADQVLRGIGMFPMWGPLPEGRASVGEGGSPSLGIVAQQPVGDQLCVACLVHADDVSKGGRFSVAGSVPGRTVLAQACLAGGGRLSWSPGTQRDMYDVTFYLHGISYSLVFLRLAGADGLSGVPFRPLLFEGSRCELQEGSVASAASEDGGMADDDFGEIRQFIASKGFDLDTVKVAMKALGEPQEPVVPVREVLSGVEYGFPVSLSRWTGAGFRTSLSDGVSALRDWLAVRGVVVGGGWVDLQLVMLAPAAQQAYAVGARERFKMLGLLGDAIVQLCLITEAFSKEFTVGEASELLKKASNQSMSEILLRDPELVRITAGRFSSNPKSYGDFLEAVVGLAYLYCGHAKAMQLAQGLFRHELGLDATVSSEAPEMFLIV